MQIWIAPRDDISAARQLTKAKGRVVLYHKWSADARTLIYEHAELGTETTHVSAHDVQTDATRDLTPIAGVQATLIAMSAARPDEILIGLNARDPKWHDIYRASLSSGAVALVEENKGFAKFLADNDLKLRLALAPTRSGGLDLYTRAAKGWLKIDTVPPEDALSFKFLGFDKSNENYFLIDSRGRNRTALVRMPASGGTGETLGSDAESDIAEVQFNPYESASEAFEINIDRPAWRVIDNGVAEDIAFLTEAAGPDGAFVVLNRTADDKTWMLHIDKPTQAGVYYLFDRAQKKLTPLPTRPALKDAPLRPMYSARLKARDGLALLAYYTLPAGQDPGTPGKPAKRAPMVVTVHGGPWARDEYGFNGWHQWLANRGYAVLSVNFRGSTGFGKAFLNAANGEWGGAMQNDIADAVAWAVSQGIAEPEKVAILGSGYGGFAALAGLAFTPKTYACGGAYGTPTNLVNLLEKMPPYWTAMRDIFLKRVGDPAKPDGRARLMATSPATRAAEIERPLLIAQGANDPVTSEADTRELVRTLKENGVPVTFVRYPDESGGLSRQANALSFHAVSEAFLGKCLGGRVEPFGSDLTNSSLEIVEGASYVPGLVDAMAALYAPAKKR
jgi:dipeptidyl aminopeptidase/acylaminoacyl peptidase